MSTVPATYVLDANVFIQAHRTYYAFSICPGFWDFLLQRHAEARLVSIDRVRGELLAGDELENWARTTAPAALFAATAASAVVANFQSMMQWVQSAGQFKPEAKAEFAQVADGWLAAYAAATPGSIVVTQEEFAADARKRVPLPNVCRQFHVEYCDTFRMLNELRARFQWQPV